MNIEGLIVTPRQCRMARAGLTWTVQDLAKKAGISPATVTHFEKERVAKSDTIETIKSAFIATGLVKFDGLHGAFVSDPECE